MNKEKGKEIWANIIKENMQKSEAMPGVDFSEERKKLGQIKFTHGGDMLKLASATRINKAYEYALFHYPTLVRMFDAELGSQKVINVEENGENGKDNQCVLCGKISGSCWAFVLSNGSKLTDEEQEELKGNGNLICRDRGACRKKREKQTEHKVQVHQAMLLKKGKRK